MYLFWLIVIILLTILEITTVNLVSIWFVASAVVSLIISFFTENLFIQFSVFVLGGSVLLLLTRKMILKLLNKKGSIPTNIDRIIGMEGIVTEKITKTKPGEVKVDGKKWTATSDKTIKEETPVIVLEIDGVKIKVKESGEK